VCDDHAGGVDADVGGCGSVGSADVAAAAAGVAACFCCHCGGCDCCCHFDGAAEVAAVCLRALYRFCHPYCRHPSACWANGTHQIRLSCWSVDVAAVGVAAVGVAAADVAAVPTAIVFAAVAGSFVVAAGVADVAAVAAVAAVACGSDNIDDVQLHWQWLADDTCCFFSAGRKGTHIKLVCGQHPVKSLSLCVNTPYGVHGGCSCAIVGGCRWLLVVLGLKAKRHPTANTN